MRILAVDDQARFSRVDNACAFITDIVYQAGRFISIGEGVDTIQEGWQLRVEVMELHNSTTIRELGRRVHRGQKGCVLDDGAAGDHPFGYESYHLDPNWAESARRGPMPKKGLRICEPEARWVHQVFEWFVGRSMAIGGIARELNRLGVAKGGRATTPGWHHQQVRRMLANPKYIGRWTWGATKVLRDSNGKTKQVAVPSADRVVRERPELRIVDQETWDGAQKRLGELEDLYGQKPDHKRRGPKPHHTDIYPMSLLGGLLFCHTCGSRLWIQGSGGRDYLGCPNHRKGSYAIAGRVPASKAEGALTGFVAEILSTWPSWVESVAAVLRRETTRAVSRLPGELRADEEHLAGLDREIGNLVDQLSRGASDSPALRRGLERREREAEAMRDRVAETRRAWDAAVAMPDDAWIVAELARLPRLLADDPTRYSSLIRRLLGRVTAETVLAPGKKRGFIRLHIHFDAIAAMSEVLGGRLPRALLSAAATASSDGAMDFRLDLGAPTRRDLLAPAIAAMRGRGVTWPEIGRETGLGTGNAHNVWRRWVDAQGEAPRDRA